MDGALNVDWSEQGACSESTLPGAGTVSAELAPVIRTSEHKEEANDETARRRVSESNPAGPSNLVNGEEDCFL